MLSAVDAAAQPQVIEHLRRQGYRVEKTFSTGRPDRLALGLLGRTGARVVAKIYPVGEGEHAFANMQQLWRSTFGAQRTPPAMAEPLDYLPEVGALIMECLEGRTLSEPGMLNEASLERSMQLLVELHQCGVEPDLKRGWRGILRSVKRKAQRISELAPQYANSVEAVVERLEHTRISDSDLACSHGDFSPRNVLAGPQRWIFIDWDRLQRADPARDVAYFAMWPWRETLLRGRLPKRESVEKAANLYETFRPGSNLRKQLPFHLAAGLVRMACGLVELWPQQAYLVPGLAKVALRELQ